MLRRCGLKLVSKIGHVSEGWRTMKSRKYIEEMKKIEDLEKLLLSIKSKVEGHEKEYPAIMNAIDNIGKILEKHRRDVATSSEYI